MTDLVGEHRHEFLLRMLLYERIEKHDSAKPPETREVRIGFGGALGPIHGKNALHFEVHLLGIAFNSGFKRTIRKGFKFIKQGHNGDRSDEHHE